MTRMLLTRHGQSEWNAQGRWQGQADPPLSELGRHQALIAAERIGAVDVVVASDLERASHTAAIIGEIIGVGPVIIEPGLRERDAGEWSGLTRNEIEARWPGFLEARKRPSGYELDDVVVARVLPALERIHLAYTGAEVLVVTHGGVIHALERDQGHPFERLANLGSRWLVHHGDRLELGDRMALVDGDGAERAGAGGVAVEENFGAGPDAGRPIQGAVRP